MTQLSKTWTWHEEYDAVVSETDKHRLWTRIEVAESIILTRRDEIQQGREHEAEREAIAEALCVLEMLKRKRLGFRKNSRQTSKGGLPAPGDKSARASRSGNRSNLLSRL